MPSNSKMGQEWSDRQIRQGNGRFRSEPPSPVHVAAFESVLETGEIPEEHLDELVDRLYDPFKDRYKELGREAPENELMVNVERFTYGIRLNISRKLYHQQPLGVLLRPIDDAVRKRGEAVISKVDPYGETTEPEVMPLYHYKLTLEPMPVWLSKWVGENGYPTR